MKLHIGCGKRFIEGWYHIDGSSFDHIDSNDIYCNAIDDNSVDIIYASHLVAYFTDYELAVLLKCWKRVLKEGGILRLATPDFRELMHAYENSHIYSSDGLPDVSLILGPIYGRMLMDGEIITHKKVYDFTLFKKTLILSGFRDVKKYDWWTTEHAHIDDHSQAYMLPDRDKENGILISLNVECIK